MHIRRGHPARILALCWSWAAVSAAAAGPRPVTLPIVDGYDVQFTRPEWGEHVADQSERGRAGRPRVRLARHAGWLAPL